MTTIEAPRHRGELYLPYGSAADGPDLVTVTPERAGWDHAALRVVELLPGQRVEFETAECEHAILPLSGGAIAVETGGQRYELPGRVSVFTRPTGFVYVGRDQHVMLDSAEGAVLALPHTAARRGIDAYLVTADEVPVEIRGAGTATRQLNNFLAPGLFEADRLTAVEVITPRGNWSSYPPHKHDHEQPAGADAPHPYDEADLEEIYYFQIDGGEDAWGLHRTYDLAEGWDTTVAVRTHDAFLVPRGYHGPCIAAPEWHMYYLNVLAGPGAERSLAFSDDPRYAWVRDSWRDQDPDPRVPLYSPPPG